LIDEDEVFDEDDIFDIDDVFDVKISSLTLLLSISEYMLSTNCLMKKISYDEVGTLMINKKTIRLYGDIDNKLFDTLDIVRYIGPKTTGNLVDRYSIDEIIIAASIKNLSGKLTSITLLTIIGLNRLMKELEPMSPKHGPRIQLLKRWLDSDDSNNMFPLAEKIIQHVECPDILYAKDITVDDVNNIDGITPTIDKIVQTKDDLYIVQQSNIKEEPIDDSLIDSTDDRPSDPFIMIRCIGTQSFCNKDLQFYVDDDGKRWYIANQIAKLLGIKYIRKSIANYEYPYDRCTVKIRDSPGLSVTCQKLTALSDSGLMILLARSDSPNLKIFQNWLYRDALPNLKYRLLHSR